MAVAKNPKTGKWYSKFRFRDYSGNIIQKKKEGFERKADAKKWEDDFIALHEGKEQLTFTQAYNKYIADCEKRFKAGTTFIKKRYLKYYTMLYNLPISEITPATIRLWQNKYLLSIDPMTDKMKFGKTTINSINGQLSAFFSWCVKFCGLSRNPVQAAGRITYKSITEKPTLVKNIWQKQDFDRFIATVKRPDHRLFYNFLFWLGLRRGEALGIRIKDIDLKGKTVRICQNRTLVGMDTPKTKTSVRTVTIPDHLAAELAEYIGKIYKPSQKDLLFSSFGLSIGAAFRRAQEKAGMETRIRLHDLRHSHASMLINAGFSPDVVADRLGHANAQMVLTIYGHMYPQKRIEVRDTLNKIASED